MVQESNHQTDASTYPNSSHFPNQNPPSMSFGKSEKLTIFWQGLMTAGIISLIYLFVIFSYRQILVLNTNNQFHMSITRYILHTPGLNRQIEDTLNFIYIISLIVGTSYRVYKTKENIRLSHILEYIEYMAEGNYDSRIPIEESGYYSQVALSINQLMDSLENALEHQYQSERSKDELMTNIGHDLRTPLTSIVGYLRLLENRDFTDEKQAYQYIQTAYRKSLMMQTLVNDLFEYTKSIQMKDQLNRVQLPLDDYLSQVAADYQIQAERKGIELCIDAQPQDLTADFDPEKMARVYSNLITNALKYGTGATKIVLKARNIEADDYSPPIEQKINKSKQPYRQWLLLQVRNNGELVSEEELNLIFKRSYRGNQSRADYETGSGLGLSIVRNLVEAHGGIAYASIEQDEMVFHIDLPQI